MASKSYRKFMATGLSAAVVASVVAPVAGAAAYDDVKEGAWYEEAINYVTEMEYMKGTGKGFEPGSDMTRAQAAQLFTNILGLDTEGLKADFSDVKEGAWYYEAIAAVNENGVMKGSGAKFNPNATLTRGQMAAIIVRAYGLEDHEGRDHSFTDIEGNMFATEIAILADLGIVDGMVPGKFAPNAPVTRAQMAAFIMKTEVGPELPMPEVTSVKAVDTKTVEVTVEGAWTQEEVDALVEAGYELTVEGKASHKVGKVTVKAAQASTSADTTTLVLSEIAPELVAGEALSLAVNGEKVEGSEFKYEAPVVTPEVTSVSAINSAQVEIKFNKAIDADSVIDANGTLNGTVVNVAKVSGTGSFTIDTTSPAKLSQDGKTLTLTVVAGALNNVKYVVTTPANSILTTEGAYVPAYTSEVVSATDTVAPSVTSATRLNASTTRVNFSEPLQNEGNWTFKFTDGTSANGSVSVSNANIAKGYVDVTITDPTVVAGKEIVATVIGAKDYALNLSSPNPLTVSFSKGSTDGVKPTVTSVTPKGLNKFEVKFSEEVQGFDVTDVSIDGVARVVNDSTPALAGNEAIITQDASDKTKYTVEVAAQSAGFHTVAIAAGVTDLSGETNTAFSQVVTFAADTTAPTLTKSEVKKGTDGYEYLHLTFSESVSLNTITTLTATQVKNFVTTQGTLDLTGLTAVDATNKEFKVKLTDVEFDPTGATTAATITSGSAYTVTLTGAAQDATPNLLGTTNVSFTRGTDAPTVAQTVTSVAPVAGSPSKVKVTFAQPIDGASATAVNNYSISGVIVESAEILAADPANTVTLTIKGDSNNLNGTRNITITGVKTADGVAMTAADTRSISLVENVAPTYTASLVTVADGVDAGDTLPEMYVKLTFSEYVGEKTIANAILATDFQVKYNGEDLGLDYEGVFSSTADAALVAGTAYNTLYLKLDETVITDLAKPLVVSTTNSDIVDVIATSGDTTIIATDVIGNVLSSSVVTVR